MEENSLFYKLKFKILKIGYKESSLGGVNEYIR